MSDVVPYLDEATVKPVLSGHRIKRTPSIKRTCSSRSPQVYFPYLLEMKPLLSGHLY